ncbi:MAG: site-specific integrase [Gemmatimonadaceae bacterium]|nr:site-specific integrase [Gemmatimonadaceae bacterium]
MRVAVDSNKGATMPVTEQTPTRARAATFAEEIDAVLAEPHTWPRDIPDFGLGSVKGFKARVNRDGSVTWSVSYRTPGGREASTVRRVKLGEMDPRSRQFLSLRDARREALVYLAERPEKAAPAPEPAPPQTIGMLFAEYLKSRAGILKPGVLAEYKRLFDREIADTFGNCTVEAVTRADVVRWHEGFKKKAYVGNRALAVIRAFYTWAAKRDLIPAGANPALLVDKFKESPRERVLTVEEFDRLSEALTEAELHGLPPAPRYRKKPKSETTAKHRPKSADKPIPASPIAVAALRFLLLSGWRLSEALTLGWDDLNFDLGVAVLTDTKTGRSVRALGADALQLIRQQKRRKSDPRVFPIRSLNRLWDAVRHAADLKDLRIHDLRHNFATLTANDGAPQHFTQKLLGHRDAKSTQRYSHLADQSVRALADKTSRTLGARLGLPAPPSESSAP